MSSATSSLLNLRRSSLLLLLAPVLVLFAGGYVLPLANLVLKSLATETGWSIQQYIDIVSSPAFAWIAFKTVLLAVVVTSICLVVAYPLAYAIVRSPKWLAVTLLFIVTLPYLTSILIRSYAWIVILSPNGVINKFLLSAHVIEDPIRMVFNAIGVYVGMVQVQLPLMVFPLYASLLRINRGLSRAAQSLGSPATDAFIRITIPLSMPGIMSGCTLVFLSCLGFYVTPALLGGVDDYLIAQSISTRVLVLGDFKAAAAQSTLLLAAIVSMFIIWRRRLAEELDEQSREMLTEKTDCDDLGLSLKSRFLEKSRARLQHLYITIHGLLSRVRIGALCVLSTFTVILLILPFMIVIPLAFSNASYLSFPPPSYSLRWFSSFFSNADWIDALLFSLRTAGLAAVLSVVVGLPAAFAVVRNRFRGRLPIYLLLISPLIIPHVVMAVSLYFSFSGTSLIGSSLGFIIAYATIGIPYTLVVFVAGLKRFDRNLERAASSLGAKGVTTLRTVTLPLLLPTLISAALFSFIAGFDDVVYGLFLSGPGATPLPMRMWDNIRLEISPQIAVIAVLFLSTLCVLVAIKHLVGLGQARNAE